MPGFVVGMKGVGYTQSKRRFPAFFEDGVPVTDEDAIARDGSRPPTASIGWNGQNLVNVSNLESTNAAIGVGYAGAITPTNGLIVEGNVLIGTTTDLGGNLQVFSTGVGIVGRNSDSNSFNKLFRIGGAHYTNSEQPAAIAVVTSTSTDNTLTLGGGSSTVNAATIVDINCGASTIIHTGTTMVRATITGIRIQPGVSGAPSDLFHVAAAGNANAQRTNNTTGFTAFGAATGSAQVLVSQVNAAGAVPVVSLNQADVSEEMMEFLCTIGVGNAIEAIGAKTLTTTHVIKVTITGGLTRYFPVGTIA